MKVEKAVKLGLWKKYLIKNDGTRIYSYEKDFDKLIDLFNKSDKATRNFKVVYEQG